MTPADWLILALAAVVVGVSKTSISGLGSVAVALFALVLPAKESTAAVLLLLIVGDIVAVAFYRRQADWGQLKRLLPAVLPGIVVGAVFLHFVSDKVLLLSIGALVLLAVAIQLFLRWSGGRQAKAAAQPAEESAGPPPTVILRERSEVAESISRQESVGAGDSSVSEDNPPATISTPKQVRVNPAAAIAAGVAAGFTTMVANAAGAVMSLYLLAIKADKARFVGTSAWFFLLVNVSKVPFSAGLGLIHLDTLLLLATLVPVVLAGTWAGRRFLRSLSQGSFEYLTILATLISGATLLTKGILA